MLGIHWYVSVFDDGRSCDAVCAENNKLCSEEDLYIPTENELLNICTDLGLNPKGASQGSWNIRPMYYKGRDCYGFGATSGLSCEAAQKTSDAKRICPCKGVYSLLKNKIFLLLSL